METSKSQELEAVNSGRFLRWPCHESCNGRASTPSPDNDMGGAGGLLTMDAEMEPKSHRDTLMLDPSL